MLWEISLLIVSIVLVIVAAFAIPMLLQIRQTARNLEQTSGVLNQNLPSILSNLDEITGNLANATTGLREQIDGVSGAVGRIQDMVSDVVQFEERVRHEIETPLVETVTTVSALVKGIKVFFDTIRIRR